MEAWNMLRQRVLTALVGIPLMVLMTWLGGYPFLATVLILSVLSMIEIRRLIIRCGQRVFPVFLGVASLIFSLGTFFQTDLIPGFVVLFIISGAVTCVGKYPHYNFVDFCVNMMSAFYVGWGFAHFLLLRNMIEGDDGFWLFIFALMVVWSTDTGAYFTGRFLGRRPFFPEISGKKTWEGFLGGLLISFLCALIFVYFVPMEKRVLLLIVTPLLSVLGQTGDLFESLFKRQARLKDTSRILPGHGGILDRFDSALWVVPVLYQILSIYDKITL
jgi:phosphatidate cytidylyltransferase